MEKLGKSDFIIQLVNMRIDKQDKVIEVRETLDPDYQYLVGITIPDRRFSTGATLESIKIKGLEFLPQGLELSALTASRTVDPNRRFFSLFKAIKINGDEVTIRVKEPLLRMSFNINIHLLLSNNPTELKDVLDS